MIKNAFDDLFEDEEQQKKNVPAIRQELHDLSYKLSGWRNEYPGEKGGLRQALNYIIIKLSYVYEYEYFSKVLDGRLTKRVVKFVKNIKKELLDEAKRINNELNKVKESHLVFDEGEV